MVSRKWTDLRSEIEAQLFPRVATLGHMVVDCRLLVLLLEAHLTWQTHWPQHFRNGSKKSAIVTTKATMTTGKHAAFLKVHHELSLVFEAIRFSMAKLLLQFT